MVDVMVMDYVCDVCLKHPTDCDCGAREDFVQRCIRLQRHLERALVIEASERVRVSVMTMYIIGACKKMRDPAHALGQVQENLDNLFKET